MSLRGSALWLLLALTLLAYANSFAGGFYFDDPAVLFNDARLQSFRAFGASVGETIRPFTKATLLVDRWLYGDRPATREQAESVLALDDGLVGAR